MKRASLWLIAALAWGSWLTPALAQEAPVPEVTPAQEPAPAEARADVQAILEAPDPSRVVEAYARARAASPDDSAILEAYVRRMAELDLPELAQTQAQELTVRNPQHGLAWGVLAYTSAQQQRTPEAMANILAAVRYAPHEPFVQRTAGQLLAWYDTDPAAAELPEALKASIERMRTALQIQNAEAYEEGYRLAREAYQLEEQVMQQPETPAEAPAATQPQTMPTEPEPGASIQYRDEEPDAYAGYSSAYDSTYDYDYPFRDDLYDDSPYYPPPFYPSYSTVYYSRFYGCPPFYLPFRSGLSIHGGLLFFHRHHFFDHHHKIVRRPIIIGKRLFILAKRPAIIVRNRVLFKRFERFDRRDGLIILRDPKSNRPVRIIHTDHDGVKIRRLPARLTTDHGDRNARDIHRVRLDRLENRLDRDRQRPTAHIDRSDRSDRSDRPNLRSPLPKSQRDSRLELWRRGDDADSRSRDRLLDRSAQPEPRSTPMDRIDRRADRDRPDRDADRRSESQRPESQRRDPPAQRIRPQEQDRRERPPERPRSDEPTRRGSIQRPQAPTNRSAEDRRAENRRAEDRPAADRSDRSFLFFPDQPQRPEAGARDRAAQQAPDRRLLTEQDRARAQIRAQQEQAEAHRRAAQISRQRALEQQQRAWRSDRSPDRPDSPVLRRDSLNDRPRASASPRGDTPQPHASGSRSSSGGGKGKASSGSRGGGGGGGGRGGGGGGGRGK
ncbi:MAG TPA: hypothetical protein VF184_11685 [Phycisphaeraceae bacterium]